jgi:hypothetical protein
MCCKKPKIVAETKDEPIEIKPDLHQLLLRNYAHTHQKTVGNISCGRRIVVFVFSVPVGGSFLILLHHFS